MAQEYGAVDLSAFQSGQVNKQQPEPSIKAQKTASKKVEPQTATESDKPQFPSSTGQDENTVPGAFIQDADDSSFEQVMKLSAKVPVIVDLWAPWCGPCKQLGPVLENLATEYRGRFLLVKVNVDNAPGLAQAFGAQSIPLVVALLGGRPVPLFQGAQPKAEIKSLIDRLLEIAGQSGITAVMRGEDDLASEPKISAEEAEIQTLVDSGELEQAIARAEKALRNNPQQKQHYQALVDQLKLKYRLAAEAVELDEQNPLQLADQFFAAGNHPQSFQILLREIAQTSGEERETCRQRLVELLGLSEDSTTVKQVRKELAKLLF